MRTIFTYIFCIVLLTLGGMFFAKYVQAQDHLIPGRFGDFPNYNTALEYVFKEAYSFNTVLNFTIRTKWGIENATALKRDSTGYYLLHLEPEHSIWYSSYTEMPCKDISENELHPPHTDEEEDICYNQDFSKADTINVMNYVAPIGDDLGNLLTDLWQDVLMQSRYQTYNTITTGGITYEFSTRITGLGRKFAYINNPSEGTLTASLGELAKQLRTLTKDISNSEALEKQVSHKAESLIAFLLDYGSSIPMRSSACRMLSACTSDLIHNLEYEYCWQAKLTNNKFPNFLIARKENDQYYFELINFYSNEGFDSLHIIPTASRIKRNEIRSGVYAMDYDQYILQPWDIVDIVSKSKGRTVNIYGYVNFTLSDRVLPYNDDTLIINFSEILRSWDNKKRLQVNGSRGWLDLDDLFTNN